MNPTPARTGLKAAIAAAAAVGLTTTGVAFAASGHAPWSKATAGAASTHATDHPTHPAHPTHPSGGPTDGSSQSTGPNSNAYAGLCRAYVSGNKAEHGKALASPAFVALVTAAGGVDNVATFCGALTAAPTATESGHPTHPVHPTHPSHPTQAASPTHPAHPSHPTQAPSHPTHPTHPTHPAKPTQAPTE